jgi:mannose-6-phosphate isomerase-like protein (cupin superfamily)
VRDETIDPILSARGEGDSVQNPIGEVIQFKARAEQTAGALTAFESAPGPSEGPPLHLHANEDEVIYFLDGLFRLKFHDVVQEAPSGSFALIPKGVPHTWQNIGDTPGRLLVIFLPATPGMEQFFESLAADVASEVPVAESFATRAEVGGMKVVGPPLAQSDPLV